ncbi:MAG: terminase large subunit [Anaerolineaceae bacterium]|nr:terminase large subunit [Anaerolineaceae bacterium]
MPYDKQKADRAVAFFTGLLRHVDGKFYNQPFKLLPWQEKIIRDVYGTVKEDGTRQYQVVWTEIPKKNGKSEMGAGTALYGVFADDEKNGEVYGCAADKKQATIIYRVASKMLDLSPVLKKRSKKLDSTKVITDLESGTFYEVLSAEAYTKHGFKPSTIEFDEIHAQPNGDLWRVMTFGTGATREQQLVWVWTTAGDDPDRESIGWEKHDYAMKVLSGEIVDPSWYVTIFNYEGDDIYNEENWHKANPSLGAVKSIDEMRKDAAVAKQSPADEKLFRQLHLNQWPTNKLSSWLPLELFDRTTGHWSREDLIGRDCYIGLDASTTTDLSAICALFPPQSGQSDWRVIWDAWIPEDNMRERIRRDHISYDQFAKNGWVHPTEGNSIKHRAIQEKVNDFGRMFNVLEVVADPAFAVMLNQELKEDGFNVVEVQQTFAQMTDPINTCEMLFREGEISHERNDLARWTFGNMSIATNGSGLKKAVKESKGGSVIRTKRIDPMVALLIAMQRARFYQPQVDVNRAIMSDDWGM